VVPSGSNFSLTCCFSTEAIPVPRTKKAAGTAVDTRNGRRADLQVVAGTRFDPPEGISDQAVEAWNAYWADNVAQVQTPVDRPVLLRWVTEMDRYLRLVAEADRQPVVKGSQGQPVENPLYGVAYKALAVVQACEKQLGMGPLNRSALGIAVIAEVKSLAEMNAGYGGGPDAGQHSDEAPSPQDDPRVISITAR
jgi:P27 family predicted phage terminase small subunit